MRLATFAVQGFQSYETPQSLRLERDVTLIAGRNNVGKSSLLRAIRYPITSEQGASSDFSLTYAWSVEVDEILVNVPDAVTRRFEAELRELKASGSALLEATVGLPGQGSYETMNLPQLVGANVHNVEIRRLGWGPMTMTACRDPSRGASVYLRWDQQVGENEHRQLAETLVGVVASAIGRQFFIAPRRSTGAIGFAQTEILTPDGSNLTNVVGTLFTNRRHTLFAKLEQFIIDVFPEIQHVEVPMVGGSAPPTAEIYLAMGRRGGLEVPLRHSGTGVEQALMLATAVLTAPPGQLILLDEPHAFLHPYAERGVIRFIRDHAEHQYVVATHSPAFLTAFPVDHARLVAIEDDGSHLADAGAYGAILKELGITAADLWSAGSILWVEGESDVQIMTACLDVVNYEAPITARAMPDAIRRSARGTRLARAAIDFCDAVTEAVLPVHVETLFLFDADERRALLKDDIARVTGGRARFLPVREVENLFLSAPAIHADISSLCESFELPKPALDEIANDLDEILSKTKDAQLYPAEVGAPDRARVVGSEVLRRIYWRWTKSEYDKVRDGVRLLWIVLASEPERLRPLLDVARELAKMTTASTGKPGRPVS